MGKNSTLLLSQRTQHGKGYVDARFVVFTAVKIHVEVFWVVTPCSFVVGYQRFGRSCCLL